MGKCGEQDVTLEQGLRKSAACERRGEEAHACQQQGQDKGREWCGLCKGLKAKGSCIRHIANVTWVCSHAVKPPPLTVGYCRLL